ncbi:hypothetical protein M378DRAFT_161999 [Amanita muscaria Koide BX008]|uniref:Uncharacterized protein n=1 Tax=Amanita muscaria (strain Koide BX008) TaxID=946122 RepID=A0A0C2WUC8_AMAMK|nr:hypothetical protein M378DRAFT_161999 [Amanita muscaria Koide BX008]
MSPCQLSKVGQINYLLHVRLLPYRVTHGEAANHLLRAPLFFFIMTEALLSGSYRVLGYT